MRLLAFIRKQLDISQQDLSEYLSISKTNLSMIEIDQRDISSHKMIEAMELHDELELLKNIEDLDIVQIFQIMEEEKIDKWKEERRILLKNQKLTLIKKLDKMKADYERLLRAFHALVNASEKFVDKKEVQKTWLRYHKTRVENKLLKNGKQAILNLEIKLACIEKELEILK